MSGGEEEGEGFECWLTVEAEAEGGVFLDCPHFTPLRDEVRERAGEGVRGEGDPMTAVEGSAAEGEPSISSLPPPPLLPPPPRELEADNERPPSPLPPIIQDPTHPPSSPSIPSCSSSSSSSYEKGAPSSTLGGEPGSNPPKSRAIPLELDPPASIGRGDVVDGWWWWW